MNSTRPEETYAIVSKIAFLLGIARKIFENEHSPLRLDILETLQTNKSARIIRNLCALRTAIERNFCGISDAMRYDLKNLNTLPEYIPTDAIGALRDDGIELIKANHLLVNYLIDINHLITEHIAEIKRLFPTWIDFNYVRDLFIMPDGLTERGVKRAGAAFNAHRQAYPYGVYCNWRWHSQNDGNILYNDRKFITLLYKQHGDRFDDFGKVVDAAPETTEDICTFLASSKKALVMVDCENANPMRLCAMLEKLDPTVLRDKIVKILLVNDAHASSVWSSFGRFTGIRVEEHMTSRVLAHKSLVDVELTSMLCREHFENNVDTFILASSDSDFVGLARTLPSARLLMALENENCSAATRQALEDAGVPYCLMDQFNTSNVSERLTSSMLLDAVHDGLSQVLALDMNAIIDQACAAARMNLTESERSQFYDRYVRPMRISFNADGFAQVKTI